MVDDETCLLCGDNQWERELLSRSRVIARVEAVCRAGTWIDLHSHRGYLCYKFLWTALFPVRRPIILARRLLGLLRRTIKHSRREAK